MSVEDSPTSRLSSLSCNSVVGPPVRKKLKLEEEEEEASPGVEDAEEPECLVGRKRPPPAGALEEDMEERKKELQSERLSRLRELIHSYRGHMKELHQLTGSKETFTTYLEGRHPPEAVLKALLTQTLQPEVPLVSSSSSEAGTLKVESEKEGDSKVEPDTVSLVIPVCSSPVSSSPPPPPPPYKPRAPVYTPRAGFLSPVKYGENLERTTPLMALQQESSLPRLLSQRLSREDLLVKCRQETWVAKRVQDLIREGLWSSRRLPKVVERLRPRVHWDSLLSEMTWMATDFHQERKWKVAVAKMLAHSAKDYVERLKVKRGRMKEEEELRRRRIAGFMASEVRAFWNRIHELSELKLSRQQRVLEYQMLEQQLSYVTQEKTHSGEEEEDPVDDFPIQGSSKEQLHSSYGENGVNEVQDSSDNESLSSDDDDESTILEQEMYEKRLQDEANPLVFCSQNGQELELNKLVSDSQRPLFQILRKDYPGVVSEYLDLYDQFVQEDTEDFFSSEEETTSSEEMDELELMTPPESGNSLELSIDSLLSRNKPSRPINNLKIRDIQTLAEEADRLKPLKSSLRHPEVPQQKVLPLVRGGELREYQRVGVDWLISMHKSKLNGAIGDEPGLGRKIMLVSFLSWLSSNDACRKPHLLIVPVSSLSNWSSTLKHWCPSLSVQKYDGSDVLRRSLRRSWRNNRVILTSYRVFFGDSRHFLKRSWNYLILHDAQNLGRVSQMTSILDLKSRYRLSFLGGHLPSNPIDLWNILYLLQPKTYTLHQEMESRTFVEGTEEYAETVKKLIAIISPFLLRRTRSQVEKQLPLPQEKVYILEMMPKQRRLYDDFLASPDTRTALQSGDPLGVSDVLKELRLVCDHPSLIMDTHPYSPVCFPMIQPCVPKFIQSATQYDPFKDIDLNSMNFVFFTHETTLTVIISDRIRKSRAPKSLIEELPNKSADSSNLPPSVPCGRLTLEFQTSSSNSSSCNSSSARASAHSSSSSSPHILLSASVIKSLKSSLNSKAILPPSSVRGPPASTPASGGSLGAFHKESLRVIATFNERRCMGLPLYGKDLVDILTIVTCIRPCKSMFRGMGLVNTLNAFEGAESRIKDRNHIRYQTQGLRSLVNASSTAFKQIHSESTIISKILCYNSPVILFPRSVPPPPPLLPSSILENDVNTRLLHSVNKKPIIFHSHRNNLMWTLPPSAKLNKLNDILRDAMLKKEHVAVFCEIKEMRDLIQVFLRHKLYSYVVLEPEDSFESKSESLLCYSLSDVSILLTSTRTSAIGLNVSCLNAKHIVLYDSSWDHDGFKSNPWVQSIARSPGVVIHRLLCKASVEESISRKSVQKKIAADLNDSSSLEHPEISSSTIEDIFSINLRDNGTIRHPGVALEKSRCLSCPSFCRAVTENDNHDDSRASTLDRLWSSSNDSNDIIKSMVVDLAELDSGCANSSSFNEIISQLDISTHKLFDNLTPIERFGISKHGPESPIFHEKSENFSLRNRAEWERMHHLKLTEFEEEVNRLETMTLLTFSADDAKRAWYGSTGQPMPLWPAPSPSNGTAPAIDGIINSNDLIEFHLSTWYATDRIMEDHELPPVYIKKESLKRNSFEAGITGGSSGPGESSGLPEIKPKLKKEDSSAHAPRSLFDRPTPALLKARKDMRINKFRSGASHNLSHSSSSGVPSIISSSNAVNNTSSTTSPSSSTPPTPVNSAVAGIRNPLPRTQVEAENTPEWLIQEDWALHQAVEDLLELPLNLTVIHPGHTPNWDMVADMVNSVSRIYRGPRQCKNRYESIIVPREEGRILYDIIPPSNLSSPAVPVINNGGGNLPHSSSSKKSKKNKNLLLKMIPIKSPSGSNRPMKTSQLYLQDNNLKWTGLYRCRFENIKSVANKRTPTAKPILVNPTQKNPKHAAVLAESGISYEIPLNPIIVAQNRADRLQKEKQKSHQQHELSQQRIASAQAAAAAAQQSAAATAARVVSSASVTPSTGQQTVVVGLSGSPAQRVQQQAAQQAQLQEMVRSSNAAVVVTSPSTVVTLASFNRLQAAQKVINAGNSGGPSVSGRPLTPHQVNLLRQQAIINNSKSEAASVAQKLRMQTAVSGASNKVSVAMAPSGSMTGVTVVTQAGGTLSKGPQIRQLTTASPGGSKTTSVRALTEQDMKILVAKQQQQQLQASGKVQLPGNVTAAQLFAQAGIKVQEGTAGGQPVATLVKTVSAIGQGGQSVTIPVQSVPHVKAALARGQQMQMKLLQQQLLQRKAGATSSGGASGAQRVAIGSGSKGLPTQLIVQKNVVPHHQAVTVQQILKGATPHAVLTKQGQGTPIQARVIPASSSGRNPQTIQVVSGRGPVSGGQFKVAASSVANSQQILNQVSAALGQPVSMAVRTSDGVPVSVALRSAPVQQGKTIITSTASLSSPSAPPPTPASNPGNSKDSK